MTAATIKTAAAKPADKIATKEYQKKQQQKHRKFKQSATTEPKTRTKTTCNKAETDDTNVITNTVITITKEATVP